MKLLLALDFNINPLKKPIMRFIPTVEDENAMYTLVDTSVEDQILIELGLFNK